MGKLRAHQLGIRHLAVSIFVFSGGDLLIQRRAAGKYHCGLLWANTCCTHPFWNEPLDDAASRRLHEELGVSVRLRRGRVLDYRADVSDGLVEHERVQVFKGVADRATLALEPNPDEVFETRWATPPDLAAEAADSPQRFAPWFRIYLERWDELGL